VLSKGEGKTTSFVVANFTLVQLWYLPTNGIEGARNPSFG
jgi:hypothetical protein